MNAYKDHAEMLNDLHTEQDDGSLKFTYSGDNYNILPGKVRFKRRNDRGGFALESDLSLTCTSEQFGDNQPQSGETISYMNLDFTITNVSKPAGGYILQIQANLASQE